MLQLSFKKAMLLLRASTIILILAILSLFLFSFTVSSNMADEVWKQLGISQNQATEKIRNSFMNGYLDHYGINNAKNIVSGNRAAAARDLLSYTKKYLSSPALKSIYDKERIAAKPVLDPQVAPDKEKIRKEKKAELEKNLKGTEETIKIYPDMAKGMKSTIDMLKKKIKEYDEPANKDIEMYYQAALMDQQRDRESHAERMKKWEEYYPVKYQDRLKAYLRKYLDLSSTVDFNAELKQRGNKKVFVDQKYEGKGTEWKQIFRAGKEVYDIAKPFAEQWLTELK